MMVSNLKRIYHTVSHIANCLLIDWHTNLDNRYWPESRLKGNEFYAIQLSNNIHKIVWPTHHSQNKDKLLEGIHSILIENNILQVLVCCNCVINLNTIQEAKYQLAFYFSNNSTNCNPNECRLTNLRGNTTRVNNLIAQDRSEEKC